MSHSNLINAVHLVFACFAPCLTQILASTEEEASRSPSGDNSQESEPTSVNRDPPATVIYQDVTVESKPAAAAESKACDGNSDDFVEVEALERALAEISNMRYL